MSDKELIIRLLTARIQGDEKSANKFTLWCKRRGISSMIAILRANEAVLEFDDKDNLIVNEFSLPETS